MALKKTRIILRALCVATLMIGVGLVADYRADMQSSTHDEVLGEVTQEDLPPPITPDVLSALIEELQGAQRYKLAKLLDIGAVTSASEELKQAFGWNVKMRTTTYLREHLIDQGGIETRNFYVEFESFEIGDYYKQVIVVTDLREREESSDDSYFIVDYAQLSAIDFDYAAELIVMHPLNEIKPSFSAVNRPFDLLVDALCKEGDVDYAIRSDLANDIHLNLSLRGRSVLDCLQFASQAAGWQVRIEGVGRNPSTDAVVFNGSIDALDEIGEIWANREFVNIGLGPDSPWRIDTPVDALRYAAREEAQSMKAKQYAAVIEPREAVEDAPEKAGKE